MRKIAVFTGTRAEYGLLYWIIKGLQESEAVDLQLFVGGMHLSAEFGSTVNQIKLDNFPITEKLEFLLSSDTPIGIGKSMGLALMNGVEVLERHRPDILVLLGDRFESMAIAQAAMVHCIPIAHIHGGEVTEGSIDESIRHCITKMSHLHFVAAADYKRRVVQLGENPKTVFNYGAPGIDSIKKLSLFARDDLSNVVNFEMSGPYFIVTYHPVTLSSNGALYGLTQLCETLLNYPDHKIIVTYPNADTHGRALIDVLEKFQQENPKNVLLIRSLGQLRYLSLLKYCDAVIGNSSSGLIEAPTLKVPTVNIGPRQKGRILGDTVISCGEDYASINEAIKKATSRSFKSLCNASENPYGDGNSSVKILSKLINFPLENTIYKKFYDLEQEIL